MARREQALIAAMCEVEEKKRAEREFEERQAKLEKQRRHTRKYAQSGALASWFAAPSKGSVLARKGELPQSERKQARERLYVKPARPVTGRVYG